MKNESLNNRDISLTYEKKLIFNTDSTEVSFKIFNVYIDKSTNSEFVCIFNEKNRHIELYDLTNECFLKSFKLISKDFITSLAVADTNNVYILFEDQCLLYNFKGNEIKSINFSKKTPNRSFFFSNIHHGFNMEFNEIEKSLNIPIYNYTISFESTEFFNNPVEAKYYIENDSIVILPVKYPDFYQKKFYGFSTNINRTLNKDKNLHVYSFELDPNLYVLNEKGIIKKFNCESNYQDEEPVPVEKGKEEDVQYKLDLLTVNPSYFNLSYDKYNKVYYRVFLKELSLKNEDGTYNSLSDKKEILQIINEDFEIVNEIPLENNKFNTSVLFPTKKGLAISSSHYKNKEHSTQGFSYYLIFLKK